MMRKAKMTTALMLAAAMAAGLSVPVLAESSADTAEETVITIWNEDIAVDGVQNNPVADAIAEKTGVRMEFIKGDTEKMKVLMAAGDLPDIIYLHYNTAQELIESGSVIALDDLVDQYAPNLKADYQDVMDYSREYISGTDELYFLPIQCNTGDSSEKAVNFYGAGIRLMGRWDLYAQQGYPELKDEDALLSYLADVVTAQPTTADGKTMYGLGLWSDWGIWPYWIPYCFSQGYNEGKTAIITDSRDNESYEDEFYSEHFWDSVRFYNKAYNMGLLDPESFTQTYDDYKGKVQNGQYVFLGINGGYSGINAALAEIDPSMGYEMIPVGGLNYASCYSSDSWNGWGSGFATCITSNCKNPEAAMKLIDYLRSPEGELLILNGIEGVHWTTNDDGERVYTQEYLDGVASDPNYTVNEGINLYQNYLGGMSGYTMYEGGPLNIAYGREAMKQSMSQVDQNYVDYYSELLGGEYEYPGEAVVGMIDAGLMEYTEVPKTTISSLLANPSEETTDTAALLKTELEVDIPNIILLPEDEVEDAIKAEIEKLDEEGYKDVSAEMHQIYDEAIEKAREESAQ